MSSELVNIRRSFKSKAHRDLFNKAVAGGWTFKVAGSGHLLLRAPDGIHTARLSTTAYDGGPAGLSQPRRALREGGLDC